MNKQTLAREILDIYEILNEGETIYITPHLERLAHLNKQLAQLVLEEDNIPPINGILDESKTVYVGIDFAKDYLNEIRDDAKQEQMEKDADIAKERFKNAIQSYRYAADEIAKAISAQQGQ